MNSSRLDRLGRQAQKVPDSTSEANILDALELQQILEENPVGDIQAQLLGWLHGISGQQNNLIPSEEIDAQVRNTGIPYSHVEVFMELVSATAAKQEANFGASIQLMCEGSQPLDCMRLHTSGISTLAIEDFDPIPAFKELALNIANDLGYSVKLVLPRLSVDCVIDPEEGVAAA